MEEKQSIDTFAASKNPLREHFKQENIKAIEQLLESPENIRFLLEPDAAGNHLLMALAIESSYESHPYLLGHILEVLNDKHPKSACEIFLSLLTQRNHSNKSYGQMLLEAYQVPAAVCRTSISAGVYSLISPCENLIPIFEDPKFLSYCRTEQTNPENNPAVQAAFGQRLCPSIASPSRSSISSVHSMRSSMTRSRTNSVSSVSSSSSPASSSALSSSANSPNRRFSFFYEQFEELRRTYFPESPPQDPRMIRELIDHAAADDDDILVLPPPRVSTPNA